MLTAKMTFTLEVERGTVDGDNRACRMEACKGMVEELLGFPIEVWTMGDIGRKGGRSHT